MTTTVAEPVFLDTNILVYSTISTSPFYNQATNTIAALRNSGCDLWISRQVIREYMATLTRPQAFTQPIAPSVVSTDIAFFQANLCIAEDGPAVTNQLLQLFTTISIGGKQIHDANIVATMLTHTIPKLLTHNSADFIRFGALISIIQLVPWIAVASFQYAH